MVWVWCFQNNFVCMYYVILQVLNWIEGKCFSIQNHRLKRSLISQRHLDLCAIEYSLVDAPTALKDGDEVCVHIWYLMWNFVHCLSQRFMRIMLTDKMNLLIKCFLAIWFLTIWTSWENSDFAWENLFKFIV